jgi:hypothetical protein|tara:strand:- start:229 stop:414 length:186 start_codon:yes stop_codon:yes gene_type:complete
MHTLSGKLHISAPSGVVRIKDVTANPADSILGATTYISLEDLPEVAALLLKIWMDHQIDTK